MKRIVFLIIMYVALTSGTAVSKPYYKPLGNVSFFYSSLSPYGDWVESSFGYAWRPLDAGRGWRPYLRGQWVWTDYGWYWVSNEPFGWATYHYGRWQYDDYYGWIWIPDDVWGPAWVEWRYNDDYIGWAPLPPQATFSVNVGITFTNRWAAPIYYWNFVPCRNFTATRIVDYVQPIEHTRRIFRYTRGAENIHADGERIVNRGIDVSFIERRGSIHVNRIDVVQRERNNGERIVRETNRDRLEIYRPRLEGQVRGEGTPPTLLHRRNQPPSTDDTKINHGDQRGDRLIKRDENTALPSGRDTRARDRNIREQNQPERRYETAPPLDQKRSREIGRDVQKRGQVREEQRPRDRQFRQERGRGKAEKMQEQPRERPQKEQRSRDRRP